MPKKSVKNQLTVVYFDDRQPITRKIRVAQKNVILEEKLLEIKSSIRRGIYLFQIRTGVFFQ